MKKTILIAGVIVGAVSLTGFMLSDQPDKVQQEKVMYEIHFVGGEVEKVESYPLYLETTGCVHLVDNQRFPKYCFVKKIMLVK